MDKCVRHQQATIELGPVAAEERRSLEFIKALSRCRTLRGNETEGSPHAGIAMSSQRAIELLVEAGFTSIKAIKIATLNDATYRGRATQVGTIAVGKDADLLSCSGVDPLRWTVSRSGHKRLSTGCVRGISRSGSMKSFSKNLTDGLERAVYQTTA